MPGMCASACPPRSAPGLQNVLSSAFGEEAAVGEHGVESQAAVALT